MRNVHLCVHVRILFISLCDEMNLARLLGVKN